MILPQSNFFIPSPPSFNSKSKIGKIPIDRDDVTIDVIDEHFYVRNFEIFVKRHFIPNSNFYDLKGTVKKGKLSAPISVTLFFGEKMKSREIRENELMFEIEENSPIGTVVGVVPNCKFKFKSFIKKMKLMKSTYISLFKNSLQSFDENNK